MRFGYNGRPFHIYEDLLKEERLSRERRERIKDDLLPRRTTLAPIKDPSYIELVRIALCYYIAKADQVSVDEQKVIDDMCEKMLADPEASANYKTEIRMVLADRGTNFSNVRRYLNRVDLPDLERFQEDMVHMAEVTDGITDNERAALSVYKSYLNERKNQLLNEGGARSGPPRVVSLMCKSCSAVLDINSDLTTAFCPYCGTKHVIYNQEDVDE